MVTGASTADLAVVLIDARNGVLEQSAPHAFIARCSASPSSSWRSTRWTSSGYSQQRFEEIVDESRASRQSAATASARASSTRHLHPALRAARRQRGRPLGGDGLVSGPALLELLEQVEVAYDRPHDRPARFPVQWVIRPCSAAGASDYRAYAGQLASGALRQGDEVIVLPGGERRGSPRSTPTRASSRRRSRRCRSTIRLQDELDISRGDADLPSRAGTAGRARARGRRVLDGAAADAAGRALPRQADHAQRDGGRGRDRGHRRRAHARTRHRRRRSWRSTTSRRVRLRTSAPLVFDPYKSNRRTGSFIMIDETSNETVGAGMIKAAVA